MWYGDDCCKDKRCKDLDRGDAPPSSARRFVGPPFARRGCFDMAEEHQRIAGRVAATFEIEVVDCRDGEVSHD